MDNEIIIKNAKKEIILKNKIVMAPLAGYTNLAYRKIIKEMGASLVFSEMISARGLIYDNDRTWELTEVNDKEHPIAIQIFGGETIDLVNAAKMLDEKSNCDIIDINMGCPVKKVLKAEAGSKIITNVDKVYEMVHEVVKNVNKLVSVKIRAGWDHSSINCVEVSKAIEKAGASLITIHGRTKSDMYSGSCNLDYIKAVKESVSIPVIGNGDIKSIDDAKRMLEYTNVDGIMVGRATFGNPWIIKDLVDYFNDGTINQEPTFKEKIEMMKYHFNLLLKIKIEKLAVLEMRTLASWYVKGFKRAKEFKAKLVVVKTKEEMDKLFKELEEQYENEINEC